jgi:protein gp37
VAGKYWTKAGNVTWGCTPASEACANCYAKRQHDRYHEAAIKRAAAVPGLYRAPFEQVQQRPKAMQDFAKWKGEVVFVSNMSDLFHPDVPFEYIGKVFAEMIKNRHNTYLILTKRADRMREFMKDCAFRIDMESSRIGGDIDFKDVFDHIWLGVTAENQQRAYERIPLLADTPAVHRWVSCEPLLGPIDLTLSDTLHTHEWKAAPGLTYNVYGQLIDKLDLVIAGGESGSRARQTDAEWLWNLYEQCKAADVRFYLKQFGDNYHDYEADPHMAFYPKSVYEQPFIGRVP